MVEVMNTLYTMHAHINWLVLAYPTRLLFYSCRAYSKFSCFLFHSLSLQPTIHTIQTFMHLIRASVCECLCFLHIHTFLWQLNCVCTKLFTYLHFPFVFVSPLFIIWFFFFSFHSFWLCNVCVCVCASDFCFHSFDFVYSSDKWKCLVAVFAMATQQLKFITIYNSFHFILFPFVSLFFTNRRKIGCVLHSRCECWSGCVCVCVSLFANGHEFQQTIKCLCFLFEIKTVAIVTIINISFRPSVMLKQCSYDKCALIKNWN